MKSIYVFMVALACLTTHHAFAEKKEPMCAPAGGSCSSSDDCCTNLCSPTSCVQGTCISSTCLADGNFCQIDCQCCSGACVQDLGGRCGVPPAAAQKNRTVALPLDCPGAACVFDPEGGPTCVACCLPGQSAYCGYYAPNPCFCSAAMSKEELINGLSCSGTTGANVALITISAVSFTALVVTFAALGYRECKRGSYNKV